MHLDKFAPANETFHKLKTVRQYNLVVLLLRMIDRGKYLWWRRHEHISHGFVERL
jgi:hypothetical protein